MVELVSHHRTGILMVQYERVEIYVPHGYIYPMGSEL